jgi:hypothetical protein
MSRGYYGVTNLDLSLRQVTVPSAAKAYPGQGRSSQPCSLAVLYAAGNMPQGLAKAHAALDKAVYNAYGYKPVLSRVEGGKPTDATASLSCLFKRYQELVVRSLGCVLRTHLGA